MNEDDKQYEIGSFGHHEALDRTSLQISNWDDFIVNHRFIELHPELSKKAIAIEALMADLYQEIGAMEK
jgi:hypothetical protein